MTLTTNSNTLAFARCFALLCTVFCLNGCNEEDSANSDSLAVYGQWLAMDSEDGTVYLVIENNKLEYIIESEDCFATITQDLRHYSGSDFLSHNSLLVIDSVDSPLYEAYVEFIDITEADLPVKLDLVVQLNVNDIQQLEFVNRGVSYEGDHFINVFGEVEYYEKTGIDLSTLNYCQFPTPESINSILLW